MINSFFERMANTDTVASLSLKKHHSALKPKPRRPRNIDMRPPSRSSKERRLLRLAGKSLKVISESKPEHKTRPNSRRCSAYGKRASVFDRLAMAETFASASAKSKAKRPSRSSWPKTRGIRASRRLAQTLKCDHYVKNCDIVARCCNHVFACRMCHDAVSDHGPIGRYRVKEVVCKECNTRQIRSNKCVECAIVFAEYYCDICNIWMDKAKEPFHCKKCGFCRLGGEANFRHCNDCNNCVSIETYLTHECKNKKKNACCPVCMEDLEMGIDIDVNSDLYSSELAATTLACGHGVHSRCFKNLKAAFYSCAICGIKSLVEPLSVGGASSDSYTDTDSEVSLMSHEDDDEDPFQVAIAKKASVDFVKLLIESGSPDLFTNKDKYGNNLLHLACRFNAPVKVVELLLDNGPVDMITAENMYGYTPLHLASQYKAAVEVVHMLLDRGPVDFVTYQDNDGYTPLHLACQFEAIVQVVQSLLDKCPGNLIMSRDNDGYLPLHLACHFKASVEVVQILLNEGPVEMVTCLDNDGYTPLHLGCRYDAQVEVIKLLIDKGPAAITTQDNEGYTPLHLVCEHNSSVDLAEILLDNGPSDLITSKTHNGNTPLYLACENQTSAEIVKVLLNRGPPESVSSQEYEGDNALHVACQFKAPLEVIQLLIEKGSSDIVIAKTNDDYTPLHLAAQFGASFDVIELLLLNGGSANLTSQEVDGYNPLHLALENHAPDEVIKILLASSPPKIVTSQTNKGWNALHHACTYKTPIELVQLIIDKGSPELFTSTTRRSLLPLHHAVAVRYKDAAKLIIQVAGLEMLISTKKCNTLPTNIIKDIIEHHSPNDDAVKAAILNNHPPALKFATDSVRANGTFILEAVKKNGNILEFAPHQFRADHEIVITAVKTTPSSLKFALGNLSQDEACLLAAELSVADQVGKSNLPLIVISTPYSIGETTTSYATEFALWINQISYFRQFRVYHPNAGKRETCDPNYTTLSWPCKGTYDTCTKPRYLKVGVPRENECCWRFNFRYYLEKSKKTGGFMIQLSGWNELMEKHNLDRGQQVEIQMAKLVGIKVFRVLETQDVIDTGDIQFDRRQIGQLQSVIKRWCKGDRKDLSVIEVMLPKVDTDASLLLDAVANESLLTVEEDQVIETLNQIG